MAFARNGGPLIVCLDTLQNAALLGQIGRALALAWEVPLYLAAVMIVPPQRPLQMLTTEEEETAHALLDLATESPLGSHLEAVEEIWVVRQWEEAIAQMGEGLGASALVIGWHAAGPWGRLDIGRTLRKSVACPVVMVTPGWPARPPALWPPPWLTLAEPPSLGRSTERWWPGADDTRC